jgi:hypothetical protein
MQKNFVNCPHFSSLKVDALPSPLATRVSFPVVCLEEEDDAVVMPAFVHPLDTTPECTPNTYFLVAKLCCARELWLRWQQERNVRATLMLWHD